MRVNGCFKLDDAALYLTSTSILGFLMFLDDVDAVNNNTITARKNSQDFSAHPRIIARNDLNFIANLYTHDDLNL